jgi:hypothetical protein
MSETLKAAGKTVVVRVDHAISHNLAVEIAAHMIATGEPLTMERLRAHARYAYASEGEMVEVDVAEWATTHWEVDEPSDSDWVLAQLWLSGLTS